MLLMPSKASRDSMLTAEKSGPRLATARVAVAVEEEIAEVEEEEIAEVEEIVIVDTVAGMEERMETEIDTEKGTDHAVAIEIDAIETMEG
jgi:hypothetical protein